MNINKARYIHNFNNFFTSHLAMAFDDIIKNENYKRSDVGYFFVTVTFKEREVQADRKAENALSRFGILYNTICNLILGKNHNRPNLAKFKPAVVA